MADYDIYKQSAPRAGSPSGVKSSPYNSARSPKAKRAGSGRVKAISNDRGDQTPKNNGDIHRGKTNNGFSDSSSGSGDYSKSQLKGSNQKKQEDFKDNPDKGGADGDENSRGLNSNYNNSNTRGIRFNGDKNDNCDTKGDNSTESNDYDQRGFNGNSNGGGRDKTKSKDITRGAADSNDSETLGERERNTNHTNSTTASPSRKHTPISSLYGSRANTPKGQGNERRKIVGFDNSEKNRGRLNIGSSTDQVAHERPNFGAWQEPNYERQRRLVERLAPYRPPAPPDPRFNFWVNHFEYYCKIGVDEKRTRKRLEDSLRSNNYRTYLDQQEEEEDEAGAAINGYTTQSSTSFYNQGYRRDQNRNNLLSGRPRTTPGRVRMRGSGEEERNDNNNNNNNSSKNNAMDSSRRTTPRMAKSSTGERHPLLSVTSSGHARRTQRSKSDGHLLEPTSGGQVPGLDRRYMGLQSVQEGELRDIVGRLTRMTSAYHAKFAPNPHVWCDNSPGAHMVIKRENTIA